VLIQSIKTENELETFIENSFKLEDLDVVLDKNSRVLVEPNVVSTKPWPETTDPLSLNLLLRHLLELVKPENIDISNGTSADDCLGQVDQTRPISQREIRRIWQGFIDKYYVQGSFSPPVADKVNIYAQWVLDVSDLGKLVKTKYGKYGLKIKDISRLKSVTKTIKIDDRSYSFEMVDTSEYDGVITLPVLKGHTRCEYTGALKLLYGLVLPYHKLKLHAQACNSKDAETVSKNASPNEPRDKLYSDEFSRLIGELHTVIDAPTFTVLDARRFQSVQKEYSYPNKIYRVSLNTMISGWEPAQVDAAAIRLLDEKVSYRCKTNALLRELRNHPAYVESFNLLS